MTASRCAVLFATLLLFAIPPAAAQNATVPVEAFGNFRRMAHTGDAGGKVKLATVAGRPATYGVGALAGLRGELLLWDGRLLVSRGDESGGRTAAPRADDEAALLVVATVAS